MNEQLFFIRFFPLPFCRPLSLHNCVLYVGYYHKIWSTHDKNENNKKKHTKWIGTHFCRSDGNLMSKPKSQLKLVSHILTRRFVRETAWDADVGVHYYIYTKNMPKKTAKSGFAENKKEMCGMCADLPYAMVALATCNIAFPLVLALFSCIEKCSLPLAEAEEFILLFSTFRRSWFHSPLLARRFTDAVFVLLCCGIFTLLKLCITKIEIHANSICIDRDI